MPMTCPVQRKDVLFHVLYGANLDYIGRLVEESVINVAAEYPSESVIDALQTLRPTEGDSLHCLQIKFFVLLNEDERMRARLATLNSPAVAGLCPHKAERFYDALNDELIPVWVKDERISPADFVDRLRQSYLCS